MSRITLQNFSKSPDGGHRRRRAYPAGTGNLYENTRSYLMWALSAKLEKFGLREAEWEDGAALAAASARTSRSKDAARLTRALVAAHRGERPLRGAIHNYEAGMRDYTFRAVRNSLKTMHQTVTDSQLRAAVFRD